MNYCISLKRFSKKNAKAKRLFFLVYTWSRNFLKATI